MTSYYLGPYALIQEDAANEITNVAIEGNPEIILKGKSVSQKIIDLGNTEKQNWISVQLINQGTAKNLVIDIGERFDGRTGLIKRLEAYKLTTEADSNTQAKLTPLSNGPRNGTYSLSVLPKEKALIILNIENGQKINTAIPLRLYDESSFYAHELYKSGYKSILTFTIFMAGMLYGALWVFRKTAFELSHALYFIFISVLYYALNWHDQIKPNVIISSLSVYFPFALSVSTLLLCKFHYAKNEKDEIAKHLYTTLSLLNMCLLFLFFFVPSTKSYYAAIGHSSFLITTFALCLYGVLKDWHLGLRGQGFAISYATMCILYSFSYFIPSLPVSLGQDLSGLFWFSYPLQAFLIWQAKLAFYISVPVVKKKTSESAEDDGEPLNKMKEAKEGADHARLLKVIEREREALSDFREKETLRMKEMEKAKEEADEANRAKSAFLAVVSHEIRTPMTGIMGMVKMLLSSNLSKQQHEYALTIQESSDAMMSLLNDILDFEKIQRGKIDIEHISFDLHRIIQGVTNLMSGHAADKKISLSIRMDDDIPRFVKGDPTRLRQVLLNLMGNAIKFTEKGGVVLYVKNMNAQNNSSNGKYSIYFGVQDSGIGISAEAQKNLFNPFAQADSSIARKFGGSGLGLAISKGLVEKMGSTVNISSSEGEGTTFFFTLQMERGIAVGSGTSAIEPAVQKSARLPDKTEIDANKPAGLKILLVDDNDITRKVVCTFLKEDNHAISQTTTAEEALDKIENDSFDIVFMDIELPGMAGNEAVRQLRKHTNPLKASLPVVALTGNVGKEYLDQYLADGMTGYVAKPIDPDKLRELVNYVALQKKDIPERTAQPKTDVKVIPAAISANYAETEEVLEDELLEDSFEDSFAPPAVDTTTQETVSDEATTVFNPDLLQSLKETIGIESLNSLLDDLVSKTDEILSDMQKAIDENDVPSLAARAHELKGMAGNFGLVEISSIAAKAEKKAKQNDSDGLSDLVLSLPDASVRAKDILKEWAAR